MVSNGTVFLTTLAAQAPPKSKVAISVRNVSAISSEVINKTPTMTPSPKPHALPETAHVESMLIIIIIVVVVIIAVLFGVLAFVVIWYRFRRSAAVMGDTTTPNVSINEHVTEVQPSSSLVDTSTPIMLDL